MVPRLLDHVLASGCTTGARVRLRGHHLGAPDDHYSIGDYPTLGPVSGDLHADVVASLHLVGAEPNPHVAVSALVDLDPLDARGGADTDAGCRVVPLECGPASVDGVVICGRGVHPEERGSTNSRGLDVAVVLAVIVRVATGALPPALRREPPCRGVVDDLGIGSEWFHDRKLLRRRTRPGDRALRDWSRTSHV